MPCLLPAHPTPRAGGSYLFSSRGSKIKEFLSVRCYSARSDQQHVAGPGFLSRPGSAHLTGRAECGGREELPPVSTLRRWWPVLTVLSMLQRAHRAPNGVLAEHRF